MEEVQIFRNLLASLVVCVFICNLPARAQSISETQYRDAMIAISEGRTADAQAILKTLTNESPLHAGAWLDLGMLYCASANEPEAERVFREVETRFSPPEAILEIIRRQRVLGCKGWQPQTDISLRVGRGIESNVNQGTSNPNFSIGTGLARLDLTVLPAFSPKSDQLTTVSMDVVRELDQEGTIGFLDLKARQFDTLHEFNSNTLFVGGEKPISLEGGWTLRPGGSIGKMTLGGSSYLNQEQIQLDAAPPLRLPDNWLLNAAQAFKKLSYPTLTGFDARISEQRLTLTRNASDSWLQATYINSSDKQSGERPGGNRSGQTLGLNSRFFITPKISSEFSFQTQTWSGTSPYSPGLINTVRFQRTNSFKAAAVYQLGDDYSLLAEYRLIRNQENISLFEFNSRQMLISLQWRPSTYSNR